MSARPELSREFVAVHKRRRIVDAMAELCAEHGYEATKIADVVARAGVARKTLYDNFGGKEELLLAAFDETAASLRDSVEAACSDAPQEDGRRVEAGLRALLAFTAAHPARARICLVEALSATADSAVRYEEQMHAFVDLLRESAPAAGRLPQTIEETLVGGVAWIVQQRLRHGEGGRVEALLPELTQFVLSPYRGVGKPGG